MRVSVILSRHPTDPIWKAASGALGAFETRGGVAACFEADPVLFLRKCGPTSRASCARLLARTGGQSVLLDSPVPKP